MGVVLRGEILNGSKCGKLKGPTMLPAVSFYESLSLTLAGFSNALLRFGEHIATTEPKY